jgi:hypothetical protein
VTTTLPSKLSPQRETKKVHDQSISEMHTFILIASSKTLSDMCEMFVIAAQSNSPSMGVAANI